MDCAADRRRGRVHVQPTSAAPHRHRCPEGTARRHKDVSRSRDERDEDNHCRDIYEARQHRASAQKVMLWVLIQPSFVYLIPVVMLFGVGLTPGVVATIIFALPPITRLTNLGIRQVGKGFKEAGSSLGLTKLLILLKIEIPLSLKTIMAGVNQTLMLALSMVVIAALIGAGGLGLTVYVALGRLDIGAAVIGGTGIVILAIILDRITQKIVKSN